VSLKLHGFVILDIFLTLACVIETGNVTSLTRGWHKSTIVLIIAFRKNLLIVFTYFLHLTVNYVGLLDFLLGRLHKCYFNRLSTSHL